MEGIIQDYGATVDPEVYIRALQGHQYIPQADQCIRNIVHVHGSSMYPRHIGILDVGCGPGRLTYSFAHPWARVLGIDLSKSFIDHARRTLLGGDVSFCQGDFVRDPVPKYDDPDGHVASEGRWDVLVAQGILHHMHGEDRSLFIKRCHEVMRDDGILIIGDEFIPSYTSPEDRRNKVAAFYLHIIAEAVKGGSPELAIEEAKNFIDDVLSGEKGCGHADDGLLKNIQERSERFNRDFYRGFLDESTYREELKWLIDDVRERAEELADEKPSENFNRGDYKVSIEALLEEMGPYGFALQERYEIGPVEWLGGMGVLVFAKA